MLSQVSKAPQKHMADQEGSYSLGAKTTVEELEATQDVILQVQT